MKTQVDSRKFALIGGSVMLIIGLFALIPTLSVYSQSLPDLYVESSYGYFLGIFAMNIINKAFLIFMGIAGIACSSTNKSGEVHVSSSADANLRPSVWWSRLVLYAMGILAVLGLFSGVNTLGGYVPIFGNNIWFNAILAALGGYFGYVLDHDRSTHTNRSTLHRI